MKKIGIVGGTSWTSTIDYYRYINELGNQRLGGLEYPECIIYSLNFDRFRLCSAAHDWDGMYALLLDAALRLETAGASMILLGANTAHIVAERIAAGITVPLIDIREATARAIGDCQLQTVGLLGTSYTMELAFYREKLSSFGIETLTPQEQSDRDYIEQTLLHELGKGIISTHTKAAYTRIGNELIERGAQGLVLGCTEIPLLLSQADFTVPVFNSTLLHARAAVELALQAE